MKLKELYVLFRLILLDFLKKSSKGVNKEKALKMSVNWLCLAQDHTPLDGGVSEGYHLVRGWLPSYPETTGYIIETFFKYASLTNDVFIKKRAIQMVDWLVNIQHEDGAISDSYFESKMVFDTGQVIFGFVSAFDETKNDTYRKAAVKAGNWLLDTQESDGTWRKHAVGGIPHTYYTRVAWSLAELHRITGKNNFLDGCIKNVEWSLSQQRNNGWFDNASFKFEKNNKPYTHTIAYTIRGILESGIYLQRDEYISKAQKSMDALLKVIPDSFAIDGYYNKDWQGSYHFSCLTGDAQLAIIFFKLYRITGNEQYLEAGMSINGYLLTKQERRIGNTNVLGALAGSYPIWGEYIHYMYPNWATKFFIDSLLLEQELT